MLLSVGKRNCWKMCLDWKGHNHHHKGDDMHFKTQSHTLTAVTLMIYKTSSTPRSEYTELRRVEYLWFSHTSGNFSAADLGLKLESQYKAHILKCIRVVIDYKS